MTTVLVVEDMAQQRAQIDRALVQAGYRVDEASSGDQALDCLKEKRYDLLITDLMMSNGTGFEVLDWVREYAPGLPVIICSAYAKQPKLQTLLTTQPYRIVRKPFRPEMLVEMARELFGGCE